MFNLDLKFRLKNQELPENVLLEDLKSLFESHPFDEVKFFDLCRQAIELKPQEFDDKWFPFIENILSERMSINSDVEFVLSGNTQYFSFYRFIKLLGYDFEESNVKKLKNFFKRDKEALRKLLAALPNLEISLFISESFEMFEGFWKDGAVSNLSRLSLLGDVLKLEDNDFVRLITAPYFYNLTTLNVSANAITAKGAAAIAESLYLLKVLKLGGNQIGSEGLISIVESKFMSNLEELILWGNNLGDEGVIRLAKSPFMANLKVLDISSNSLGDESIIELANSENMSSLVELDLSFNNMSDVGVSALVESPYLANIEILKFRSTERISFESEIKLRERFGSRVELSY